MAWRHWRSGYMLTIGKDTRWSCQCWGRSNHWRQNLGWRWNGLIGWNLSDQCGEHRVGLDLRGIELFVLLSRMVWSSFCKDKLLVFQELEGVGAHSVAFALHSALLLTLFKTFYCKSVGVGLYFILSTTIFSWTCDEEEWERTWGTGSSVELLDLVFIFRVCGAVVDKISHFKNTTTFAWFE